MEQAKYLMWRSSSSDHQRSDLISSPVRQIFSSSNLCTSAQSWEERAFAVDSAGNFLGGCTWPPTSYTCSFCRREFRSAQALGGHMNVHRRDRAKLKQSSSCAAAEESSNDPSHNPSHDLLMNLRANSSLSMMHSNIFYKDPEVSTEEVIVPHLPISSPNSFFSSTSARQYQFDATEEGKQISNISILQLKHGRDTLKNMGDQSYDQHLISRNYIFHNGEETVGKKRRRTDIGVLPFLERSSEAEVESEVHKFSPNPVEELDLELRLGCHSKLDDQQSCKDIVVVE